jgi:hypothetical protein
VSESYENVDDKEHKQILHLSDFSCIWEATNTNITMLWIENPKHQNKMPQLIACGFPIVTSLQRSYLRMSVHQWITSSIHSTLFSFNKN